MKNFNYPVILMLLLVTMFSCTDELNETVEKAEDPQISEAPVASVASLNEIDNPFLSAQLQKSTSHIKDIISSDFDYLLAEHDLNGLFLDTDYVGVETTSEDVSYTFLVVIPNADKSKSINQFAYLTLNYRGAVNTENNLALGYQLEYAVSFDGSGNLLVDDSPQTEYYTPKPKGLPSKAPKSVICRYKDQLGINASVLVGYCPGYTAYGGTIPAPQYILDALFAPQLNHNYNDLYFVNPIHPNGQSPFSSFYSYYFPQLRNEIINYYQKVYVTYLGYSISTTSNVTQAVHVNKQAFLDSFFDWIKLMQTNAPNTYTYLINNKPVMYQLFNFFADYNLKYDEFEGVYLGLQYGGYSSNLDIRCVSLADNFLLTPSGLTLIQQLGSGTITMAQFRSSLTNCN